MTTKTSLKHIALGMLIGVFCCCVMGARGNTYSTKADQALQSLIDVNGNISNFVLSQPPAGTLTAFDFAAWDTAGNYKIIDTSGAAGINDSSDYIIYDGVGDYWRGDGRLQASTIRAGSHYGQAWYDNGANYRWLLVTATAMDFDSNTNVDMTFTSNGTGDIVLVTDGDSFVYFDSGKAGAAIYGDSTAVALYETVPRLRLIDTTTAADDWEFYVDSSDFEIRQYGNVGSWVRKLVVADTVQTNSHRLQVMLEGTGTLTNGSTNTKVTYMDATPHGEWTAPDADFTSTTETTTYYKEGAASLKVVAVDAASAGDTIVTATLANEDWSDRESVGVWIYSTVALSAGDFDFRITDDGGSTDLDVPAVAVNTWTWVEIDQSGVANADKDVISAILFIYTVDKGALTVYFDFLAKWDAADETTLGQDILTDGMLSASACPIASGTNMAWTAQTEYTDYFINYESGATDKVVVITDESLNCFMMAYTYQ